MNNNRNVLTKDKGLTCNMKIWQAALYVRLSREDGDKSESDSVANQKELLKEFARLEEDIEVVVDDEIQKLFSDYYNTAVYRVCEY